MSPWQGITFGVELEFMTPAPSRSMWRSTTSSAAARYKVAKRLAKMTSLPVGCACNHDSNDVCTMCTDVPIENIFGNAFLINPPRDRTSMPEYACFLFKREYLAGLNDLNAIRSWPAVEVSTPVFGQNELASGLATMKTFFSAMRQMDFNITADESCGMHVHVGVEQGMTLYLAKRIATLAALLEMTLIIPLIAPPRWTSRYAVPIYDGSQASIENVRAGKAADVKAFRQHLPRRSSVSPSEWNDYKPKALYGMLKNIWFCRNLKELSEALRHEDLDRCGLAISLRDRQGRPARHWGSRNFEGTPSTVEFRYSQMTFDHVLLRNWVEVVTRIVDLARAEGAEFKRIAGMIITLNDEAEFNGSAAWKSLLQHVLKLGHRIPDWEAQLAKFERGEYISHLDNKLLLQPENE
ncbi:hypothetical protein FLONG3_4929 [Fusarium longipes]|uniref:Amidoligase enzyme n=1 Tax=Fusarium longipes TaxID=694270 RepID=A0A395SWY0_9HYPO|nr:hypothetical protein FLONG3_4929 [Fusarium longipes]